MCVLSECPSPLLLGSNSVFTILLSLSLTHTYTHINPCTYSGLHLSNAVLLHRLKWNYCLAVTYPARNKYGIKRGDKWDEIHRKSGGQCLTIHLPILQTGSTRSEAQVEDDDIPRAFQKTYCLSEDQRQSIRENEIGRRRNQSEGKACLERYRLASSRIFGVVLHTLQELLGKDRFCLERASIDELFLDVTDFCWSHNHRQKQQPHKAGEEEGKGTTYNLLEEDVHDAVANTVYVGGNNNNNNNNSSSNKVEGVHEANEYDTNDRPDVATNALRVGCWVAVQIRKAVAETLGFTLSAGISTGKTVAKLAASHGKPNGQAVVYPNKIPFLMNTTPIRKFRHLGGKLGKRVGQLVLESNSSNNRNSHSGASKNEGKEYKPTMGDVVRHLPLPVLSKALGLEMGRFVYDVARGIDTEEVKETAGALVKSITAFKSFYAVRLSSGEVVPYFELLAADVMARVRLDAQRNHRYPKSCNLQYVCSGGKGGPSRRARSVRIPFPKEFESENLSNRLAQRCRQSVIDKEGSAGVDMHRIGVCAVDFESRATTGIDVYFNKRNRSNESTEKTAIPMRTTASSSQTQARLEKKRKVESQRLNPFQAFQGTGATQDYQPSSTETDQRIRATATTTTTTTTSATSETTPMTNMAPMTTPEDKDMEMARKLQAKFDREHAVLSTAERRGRSQPKQTKRIESFFRQKS